MALQAFVICSMLLLSSVICLPLNSSPESTTTARPEHGSSIHHREEEKISDKADEKTTFVHPDETAGDRHQAIYCNKTVNISINYTDYEYTTNGKLKGVEKTEVFTTNECCNGYVKVGGLCRLDLCGDKSCDDPNSKCVTVKRCGQLLPIFIYSNGIISSTCTQPEETQAHLNRCGNTTTARCEETSCNNFPSRQAVCFNTKCGDECTAEPTWLKISGDPADCLDK